MTKFLFLIAGVACIGFAACQSSTSANPPLYLLQNANWDSAGTYGWNGWTFRHTFDTIDFEQDAPVGGGTWGFKIHSVDLPVQSNNIIRSFTNLSSGVYQFSLWEHTKYLFPDSIFNPAWMSITKISGGAATTVTDSLANSLTWISQSMLDTLILLPSDTVTIQISSGMAIIHGNPTTVDDFTFAKLP